MPVSHYLVRRNPVRRRHTSQLYANNAVAGLSHPRFGRVKYVIGPKAERKAKPKKKAPKRKRKAPARRRRY